MRPDPNARSLGLVAGVVAAVALVALASRGDHGGGDRILVVPSTATTATRVVVLGALGVLVLGVVALILSSLSLHKPKVAARPHFWLRVITSVAVLLLVGIGMAQVRQDKPERRSAPQRSALDGGTETGSPRDEGGSPAWGMAVLGVVLTGAAGAVIVVATRRRRRDDEMPVLPIVAPPEARDDAVARARACTDPREAVLLSFAAAEAVLSVDPETRRPPATSAREWSSRVPSAPLATIVSRYEIARFSDHTVSDADRRVALDALTALT